MRSICVSSLFACCIAMNLVGCTSLSIQKEQIPSRIFSLGQPHTQQSAISISWDENALANGAPRTAPLLLALERHQKNRLQFRFLALGTIVWHIDLTSRGIYEKKSPWLPSQLTVREFLDNWALAKRTQLGNRTPYRGFLGTWTAQFTSPKNTCWHQEKQTLCIEQQNNALTLTRKPLGYTLTIRFTQETKPSATSRRKD